MISRIKFLLLAIFCGGMLLTAVSAQAQSGPVPSERYLRQHYVLTGPDEATVLMDARSRALRSATARIFFTDYLLRARNLITPYLEQNYAPFISHERVSKSEIQGGKRYVEVDITVDCEKLFRDLDEKKFLYRPAIRPVLYVYMAENFNGVPVSDFTGRQRILEEINKRGEVRYLWEEDAKRPTRNNDVTVPVTEKKEVVMTDISPYEDPTLTSATLLAACREAERNEVEVFLAGAMILKTVRENKEVYFDKFQAVEAKCTLQLVRADTGEVLSTVSTAFTAQDRDLDAARKLAARSVIEKMMPELLSTFDKKSMPTFTTVDKPRKPTSKWDRMMLREADLRLMTVGLNSDVLETVRQILAGLGGNVEMLTRSSFAGTSVISVTWPGQMSDLFNRLHQTVFPGLNVIFIPPNGMILQVI
ncbi:TPA: hypothetical protein DDW35_04820 [Candidatus Sumerlaeota bacterium]|nr:hypothetical protein [Candidatus Sumerlaeota bacterium]